MSNYIGFDKLKAKLSKEKGITNPGGLAATIARKKYGSKAVAEHAAKGTSMEHTKHLKKK